MFVNVLVVPVALFVYRLMYQSSVWSLSVIASYAILVSSSVICFSSHIFAQMNKCFSGSFATSPRYSGNLMVGLCPTILDVELLSPCGVDTWIVLPKLAPLVVFPCVDVLPIIWVLPNFGCLNNGVLFGVLVAYGFMGSTLTLIWIGLFPSLPILRPIVFL